MAKNKKTDIEPIPQITEEQKQQFARMIGFCAGLFSKYMLTLGGCEVDYKINGENISDIQQLHKLEITDRIKLAVKEERYEDAAKLKKLFEAINPGNDTEK